MHIAEEPVPGAVCRIVWGDGKSPLTVSLMADAEEVPGPALFGAMVYAVPYRDSRAVTSVLVPSANQAIIDTANHLAEVLAMRFKRPIFVNSAIGGGHMMMYKAITDMLTEKLA